MNKKLIILGSGGYGRTVYDIAEQLGYSVTVLDDSDQEHPIPAFGNNEFRLQWINRIEEEGGKFTTLIHLNAYVSPKVHVSTGCVILPGGHCEYRK